MAAVASSTVMGAAVQDRDMSRSLRAWEVALSREQTEPLGKLE
jgi:hypothetical protein